MVAGVAAVDDEDGSVQAHVATSGAAINSTRVANRIMERSSEESVSEATKYHLRAPPVE